MNESSLSIKNELKVKKIYFHLDVCKTRDDPHFLSKSRSNRVKYVPKISDLYNVA